MGGPAKITFTQAAYQQTANQGQKPAPKLELNNGTKIDVSHTKQDLILHDEIFGCIFNYLGKKDLLSGFLTCKQLSNISISYLINNLENDFKKFEDEVDEILHEYQSDIHCLNGINEELKNLNIITNKLTSLKGHCVFLLRNSDQSNEKIEKILHCVDILLDKCGDCVRFNNGRIVKREYSDQEDS